MALANLPGIPEQFDPRIRALIRRLEDRELTLEEVTDHALESLGRIRIDSAGIGVSGEFGRLGFGPSEFRAIIDSVLNLIDYLPMLRGREMLIKQGNQVGKIRLGLLMRMVPSNEWESGNERLPMIEILSGVKAVTSILSYLIGDMEGVIDLGEKGFRIHRLEEFFGWSADWEGFSRFLDIAIPALALTTREVAERLGSSATAWWDAMLRRCGV